MADFQPNFVKPESYESAPGIRFIKNFNLQTLFFLFLFSFFYLLLKILSSTLAGDGLGLKVVGGKDIPGTNMIGAYIERIHPSLSMNEIREGSRR